MSPQVEVKKQKAPSADFDHLKQQLRSMWESFENLKLFLGDNFAVQNDVEERDTEVDITINAKDYRPEEVTVDADEDGVLCFHCEHKNKENKDDNFFLSRKYHLPSHCLVEKKSTEIKDGQLIITIPKSQDAPALDRCKEDNVKIKNDLDKQEDQKNDEGSTWVDILAPSKTLFCPDLLFSNWLDSYFKQSQYDLKESENELEIILDVKDYNAEDLDVQIDGSKLKISGDCKEGGGDGRKTITQGFHQMQSFARKSP